MTKLAESRYTRYRDHIARYGQQALNQAYKSFSSKKYIAWTNIKQRCSDEGGFALSVVGAGSHFFSTGYLRIMTDGSVELVYDYCTGTDRIKLTDAQRLEISRTLCREV